MPKRRASFVPNQMTSTTGRAKGKITTTVQMSRSTVTLNKVLAALVVTVVASLKVSAGFHGTGVAVGVAVGVGVKVGVGVNVGCGVGVGICGEICRVIVEKAARSLM